MRRSVEWGAQQRKPVARPHWNRRLLTNCHSRPACNCRCNNFLNFFFFFFWVGGVGSSETPPTYGHHGLSLCLLLRNTRAAHSRVNQYHWQRELLWQPCGSLSFPFDPSLLFIYLDRSTCAFCFVDRHSA